MASFEYIKFENEEATPRCLWALALPEMELRLTPRGQRQGS